MICHCLDAGTVVAISVVVLGIGIFLLSVFRQQ